MNITPMTMKQKKTTKDASRITISLEPELIAKLKAKAEKEHKKYQPMIREYLWKLVEK